MTTTLARTGSALAAAGLLIGMLSACTPQAEPTPKPTKTAAFASDEEAFAAAEETYRAYVDAGNSSNGDEDKYLAGIALENHLDSEHQLKEAGLHVEGETSVTAFDVERGSLADDRSELVAAVCLDLDNLRTVFEDGSDATPINRPDQIAMRVEMRVQGGRFLIFEELDADNALCAG